jgi:Plasmid pRiA4b ORF-3-like protein
MRTTRLHVTLLDVTPTVVRVVDVPAASTLAEVHELLQSAIGWTDSHLHEFDGAGARYGRPDDELDLTDDSAAGLKDLSERFTYLYDYGDGWTHDVRRLGAGADRPGCPYGEGACPPEDCGGPPGYEELLATGATVPDFDPDATDLLVQQTAGAVPSTVRLLLDLARDGIVLTPGGRLPRSVVREVQQHRPRWAWSEKPAHVEDDLPPLCALHDLLRETGLLRLRQGALRPIRAADDDLEVMRRLRSWSTGEEFTGRLIDLLLALICTGPPQTAADLADRILPLLGRGWVSDGHPLTTRDVTLDIHRLNSTLRGLDVVEDDDLTTIAPGPSARWLSPRATRLAHLKRADVRSG